MIRVHDLSIDLGAFHLRDVELSIREGEYMVLLGPTGAGKTVLIECIAGIHRPKSGSVLIGDTNVVDWYPEERNVGYVPQDYALFPNMRVEENLAYGLEALEVDAAERKSRVEAMMSDLGILHLRRRYPLNLSGGERQRVALGRALVTHPKILLLDEPLSALDENLRSELASELRAVQKSRRGAFLHVCHSFEEAAEVGDRIAIMHEGRIVQVGSIEEVVARPRNLFVARFSRARNFLETKWEREAEELRLDFEGDLHLRMPWDMLEEIHHDATAVFEGEASRALVAVMRPESIRALPLASAQPRAQEKASGNGRADGAASLATFRRTDTGDVASFVVEKRVRKLTHDELHCGGPATLILHETCGEAGPKEGDAVALAVSPRELKLFAES